MSINGIGAGYPEWRQTGKTQTNASEISFASRMGGVNMAGGFFPQRTSVNVMGHNSALEAYRASASSGTHNVKRSYDTYESENYRIVPDNEDGCFDIYNKQGEKLGVFDYSDIKVRQDCVTGKQFLISEHGTMSYDALVIDNELKEALQSTMGVETLEREELQGYTLKTHSGTGIQYLIRDGEEGRGGKVLLQSQADMEKYEALAETYFNKYPNLVHDKTAGYIWADLEIKGVAQHTNNGIVSMGFDKTSNVDIYRKYLESKYGRVIIKDVPKDQKTLEKLGKSMSGNDVVIAPNILEEMANDPEKAAYYEQKIDYFFDTIIPRETARCASMGLVFEPAGVVVHKDGTVTYICGCSDSPERVAQVKAINKAKQEKRAVQRKAAFERSREEAERQAQEIELSARRHRMAEALADYNAHAWETVDANVFYIGLGLVN